MSYRPCADFMLSDWPAVESLPGALRFVDHSRGTFASVLDSCEKFAPFNRITDTEEPRTSVIQEPSE